MDSVHEADEPGDVGICQQHLRVFECYCNQCYRMICPSCLMFGAHKGHPVAKIEEGCREIRLAINHSAKEGYLKFDRTENVLLDIRHVKLSLTENEEKIVTKATSTFDELIHILKERKKRFLEDIATQMNAEHKKVEDAEQEWVRKQELSQKILELQTSPDDLKLMEEGKAIIEGLRELEQPLAYKQIRLIESIRAESVLGKNTISVAEIKQILRNFMQVGEPTLNKLKC